MLLLQCISWIEECGGWVLQNNIGTVGRRRTRVQRLCPVRVSKTIAILVALVLSMVRVASVIFVGLFPELESNDVAQISKVAMLLLTGLRVVASCTLCLRRMLVGHSNSWGVYGVRLQW